MTGKFLSHRYKHYADRPEEKWGGLEDSIAEAASR